MCEIIAVNENNLEKNWIKGETVDRAQRQKDKIEKGNVVLRRRNA